MQTLTVVVITRNEEDNLADCLDSVAFANEIVVVDDGSTDSTREIAARYTDKVFSRELDRFGRQKQFAIEQATRDWILVLDADERLSKRLAESIGAKLELYSSPGVGTRALLTVPIQRVGEDRESG